MKLILSLLLAASMQAAVILPGQVFWYDSQFGSGGTLQTSTGASVAVPSFQLPPPCIAGPTCTYDPSFVIGTAILWATPATVDAQPIGNFLLGWSAMPFMVTETTTGAWQVTHGRFDVEAHHDVLNNRVVVRFQSGFVADTPEPGTWAMLAAGAALVAWRRRLRG